MDAFRQTLTVRIARDRAVEVSSFVALCGAVICAGIAGGIEVAGGIALLGVRLRPGDVTERYRELRFDREAWTVVGADGATIPIEPPVVHLAHRAIVVLQVLVSGRTDFLVFSPWTIPRDDLRRLRVRLRAGGLPR